MEPREKAILRKNFIYLREHLDVDNIKPYLYEKQILTSEDMEVLGFPHITRAFKVEILLLKILPLRGHQAYNVFKEALNESQSFIVDKLNWTVITESDLRTENCEDLRRTMADIDEIYGRVNNQHMPRGNGFSRANDIGQPADQGLDVVDYPEDVTDSQKQSLPADCFRVRLLGSEAARTYGLSLTDYILRVSATSIELLKPQQVVTNLGPPCVSWDFTVIRKYGTGINTFSVEVGRRAWKGEGYFYFETQTENEGSAIEETIKKKINQVRATDS